MEASDKKFTELATKDARIESSPSRGECHDELDEEKEWHLGQFKRSFGQIILSVKPFTVSHVITTPAHTADPLSSNWIFSLNTTLIRLLISR